MTHHFHSLQSTRCAAAKPNRLLASSLSADWTSLHLDHHEGAGRSEAFNTHATDDLTLVVALAGRHEIEVFSHGRWRSAHYQPGSAGMTAPGQSVRLRWRTPSEREPFQTLNIYLPASLVADIANEYRRAGQAICLTDLSALSFQDPALAAQARALLQACQTQEPDVYAAGAARWMITHLLSRLAPWRDLVEDGRDVGVITDRRLARVLEHMTANLDQVMTLDDLACEAGISVHHFGRRFREAMGMGPAAFLTSQRMSRAKRLLRTTDLSINEIGRRCGYPKPSGFATAFLRHAGITATRYRAAA